MKQRIITALAILAVVLPPLVLGGFWLKLLIAAFAFVAIYEILNCQFHKISFVLYAILILAALGMSVFDLPFLVAVMGLLLMVLFLYAVCFEEYSVDKVGILFMFMVLISFTIRSMFLVYDIYGPLAMIHIGIATYMCDTGAYFCGRFFGRHKLNERISPKKTIEGSVGGWLCGAVCSFAFGYFLIPQMPFLFLVLTSLLMPVVGQIGDLAFSAIKRHDGIKDFGNIFPGHGGVLDRIDSLIFNLVLWMCLYLMFVMVM